MHTRTRLRNERPVAPSCLRRAGLLALSTLLVLSLHGALAVRAALMLA